MSKGIDYYAFINDGFGVTFSKPTNEGKDRQSDSCPTANQMWNGNFQISKADVSAPSSPDLEGTFKWQATQGETEIDSRHGDINVVTGDLSNTNMGDMLATPSLVKSDYCLSYGYYDSSFGKPPEAITNQDQSYVYLTHNQSSWMGDLTDRNAKVLNKPFSTFALPGAHDAGMFTAENVAKIIDDSMFHEALEKTVLGAILTDDIALRLIIDLSMTQKDNVATMLNLGVRYFDFRPGLCINPSLLDGDIFHQHSFVPGYAYRDFLSNLMTWLETHKTEVVVVAAGHSGFVLGGMYKDAQAQVQNMPDEVKANLGSTLIFGDKSDLGTSIADLRSTNKRLLFLNQYDTPQDATKYDSYSSAAYTTTDVKTIISALATMNPDGQKTADYTVLQLQGTASGTPSGIATALYNATVKQSETASPLMSTKANFDHSTYPWLAENVVKNLDHTHLVVLLNDFADNALSNYASDLTAARAAAG